MDKFFAASTAVIALMLGAIDPAHAGVIYRWMNDTPDPQAGRIDAFIEFGSEFWSPGKTLAAAPRDNNPDTLESYFGIESIYFGLAARPFDSINWSTNTTCADYGPGSGLHAMCSPGSAPDTRVISLGIITSWSFDLVLGDFLTGSIAVNDGSSDFRMSSMDSLWTITRLGSDFGVCFQPGVCDGGTGAWVLDRTTIPGSGMAIAEPASLSLILMGMAAWRLRGRRKHR